MADENKNDTQPKKATKASKTELTSAGYTKGEAETIKVRAADGTQLYDPVTQTFYTDSKKGVEARANDQFVQTNLDRGKLKKVN